MAVTFLVGALIEAALLELWSADAEKQSLQRHREGADSNRKLDEDALDHWTRIKYGIIRLCQRIRNNSFSDDPNLDVSLRLLVPATILAAVYCLGRMYNLVEDLAAFRTMPSSAFESVEWTSFIPHVG